MKVIRPDDRRATCYQLLRSNAVPRSARLKAATSLLAQLVPSRTPRLPYYRVIGVTQFRIPMLSQIRIFIKGFVAMLAVGIFGPRNIFAGLNSTIQPPPELSLNVSYSFDLGGNIQTVAFKLYAGTENNGTENTATENTGIRKYQEHSKGEGSRMLIQFRTLPYAELY